MKTEPEKIRIYSPLPAEILQRYLDAATELPDSIGVFAIDKNYRFILFNQTYEAYIAESYGTEIKAGDNYLEVFSEYEDIEKEKATLDQALQGIKFNQIGHYFHNNAKYYFKDTYKPIKNSEGEVIGTVVQYRNITHKKKQEITWATLLNISRKANEAASISTFIEDLRTELSKIIDTGNFFVALYNKENNRYTFPFYKDHYDEVKLYEHYDLSDSSTDYVRRTGKPLILDDQKAADLEKNKIIKLYGTHSPSWMGIPLKTNEGVIGVLVVQNYEKANQYKREDLEAMTFISGYIAGTIQRKQNEEKLHQTAKQLKHALELAQLAIIKIKPDTNTADIGEEACQIFGLSEEGMVMTIETLHELIYVNDRSKFKAFIAEPKQSGVVCAEEFRIVHKQTKKLIYLSGKAERVELKYPLGHEIHLIVQDISRQHQDKQILKQAKEDAERSDKLKSAFLANMSHEIRTPMNAILGFSEFISKENIPKSVSKKYAGYISKGAKDLLRLLSDILDTAKMEAGELQIEKENFDLHQLLSELKLTFDNERKNQNKDHIKFSLKIAVEADKLFILSDRIRLKQVFTNMLNNAFKFIKEGKIEFGYQIKSKDYLEFFVKDTGPGIPQDKKELVFSRFGQLQEDKIMHPGGTGLGLSISKNLIEALGGQIDFTSEPEKGTIFTFTLPFIPAADESDDSDTISHADKVRRKTILIYEKNKLNIRLFKDLFNTHTKRNNLIFFKQIHSLSSDFKQYNPALILINMSFDDVLKQIWEFRKLSANKTIAIIGITNFADESEFTKANKHGIDDLISKPYTFENFFGIISKYID